MSSLPGYTLEAFLIWNYDLVVEDEPEANFSLGMAETLGTIPPRPRLPTADFRRLVELFEPHRQQVEWRLDDFEPEEQSWRDYAGVAFDFIADETYEAGRLIVQGAAKSE
jgi:hypothetical protein